jgi:hypothetical protein
MEENESVFELQVDQPVANNLIEVARWAKFLALSVLIGAVLSFILFLVSWGKIAGKLSPEDELEGINMQFFRIAIIIFFFIFAGILGVLFSFLIKAANRIRAGINNNDQMQFNNGIASLKSYFAMYGVLSIVMLCLSIIGLLSNR